MAEQLRPLFDRLVVKELKPDEMRHSGLMVPSTAWQHQVPPQEGIVLAVGPGLDWWESVGMAMPVQPGDHVMFPSAAGVYIEVNEERLLVLRVFDLLGVVESTTEREAVGGRQAGEHSENDGG